MTDIHSRSTYDAYVRQLEQRIQGDAALKTAIGGEFIAVGKLEHHLLRFLGLAEDSFVVDVGCGSGRLASQLAIYPKLRFIGCDVVPQLLELAARLSNRDDWKFVVNDDTSVPCADATADFICFFSVLTHLLHEDSYKFLRDAKRALKPGGKIVFSFLEFRVECHWHVFSQTVEKTEPHPLNQFIDRDAIAAWSKHLGLEIEGIWDGDKPHFPIPELIVWEGGQRMEKFGCLGQSVAVLRNP